MNGLVGPVFRQTGQDTQSEFRFGLFSRTPVHVTQPASLYRRSVLVALKFVLQEKANQTAACNFHGLIFSAAQTHDTAFTVNGRIQ